MNYLNHISGRGSLPSKRVWGQELWDLGIDFARSDTDPNTYPCYQWTLEKLYFLSNYVAQMTQAMVGNPKFHSVNYVDLFAGSGICTLKTENGRRYPGSSLLASLTNKPFDRLITVEKDTARWKSLGKRVKRACEGKITIPTILHGDSNLIIDRVIDLIPGRSLTLAFIDPYSLDAHFDAIMKLTQKRAVDLLILFAVDTDLIRNVENTYYGQSDSKLDRFLGKQSNWRSKWDHLENRDAEHLRDLFASIYLESLSTIGYKHSEAMSIPRHSRPMYKLVFASKHPLGLKFWRIAADLELGQERGLFGPE